MNHKERQWPAVFYGTPSAHNITELLDLQYLEDLENKLKVVPYSAGKLGAVGRSQDGSRMFKVGMNMERDYANLDYLQHYAALYLPVPVRLVYDPRVKYKYVLEMMNAGATFRDIELSNEPLTVAEKLICQLQWIHFVLLCAGNVYLCDMHANNMCLRWRGPEIEVRFIDAGAWELPPWVSDGHKNHYIQLSSIHTPLTVFQSNVRTMFQESEFMTQEECEMIGMEEMAHPLNLKSWADKVCAYQSQASSIIDPSETLTKAWTIRREALRDAIYNAADKCSQLLGI